MTVLVTGATGFIGSHLARRLLDDGDAVRVLVRSPARLDEDLRSTAEVITGDLLSPASLTPAVKDVTTVIHLAGTTHALRPRTYYRINTGGTANLVGALLQEKVDLERFLFVSSLAAVGPSPSGGEPLDEDAPLAPVTPYGESKRRCEVLLTSVGDRFPVTMVRPPIVYGPGDEATLEFFKIAQRRLFPTSAPRNRHYSVIHALDLVEGIIAATRSPRAAGRTYFLAHETPTTWNDLIATIHDVLGTTPLLRFTLADGALALAAEIGEAAQAHLGVNLRINRSRLGEFVPRTWLCSPRRAWDDFRFRAATALRAGLETTAQWYREHQWL